MSTSLFDHAWHSGFVGDPELAEILSEEAELARMLQVEAAYSRALGSPDAAIAVEKAEIDPAALNNGCKTDGLPVPALVRELKRQIDEQHHEHIHKGMTSQDVMDTALILSFKRIIDVFEHRLTKLQQLLSDLDSRFGAETIMGRTRMQAALPITVADRILTWSAPLVEHETRLAELKPRLLQVQFGGAVGTRVASGKAGEQIARLMSEELGLGNPAKAWHAMRDKIVEFASWQSLVTGTLGKMGQDISLLSQQGIDEMKLSGGGGSSAMPHKQNPVKAELLVTLARYNSTQLAGMHSALVHEQERSGAAWTLEWFILPQMLMATGTSLATAIQAVGEVDKFGQA